MSKDILTKPKPTGKSKTKANSIATSALAETKLPIFSVSVPASHQPRFDGKGTLGTLGMAFGVAAVIHLLIYATPTEDLPKWAQDISTTVKNTTDSTIAWGQDQYKKLSIEFK